MISTSDKKGFLKHIQGLRALAVAMVVFFHFEIFGVSGGFAGVDVFFVLSGFLVTTMLVNRSENPFWSGLLGFYFRRLMRIVPAYLVVLLLVLVLGWFFFLPLDFSRLGRSTAAAALFVSNQFFQSEVGYFDTSSIFKPLLHTWSLSVEIQFYLFWPLAFAVVGKFSEKVSVSMLVASILASFAAACLFTVADTGVAFYTLPTRLWEFGVGALLAVPLVRGKLDGSLATKPIVQLVAFVVLIGSAFGISEDFMWPGPWAVLPVLATATLLLGGMTADNSTSLIFKFLSSRAMVWLGSISYSLYLVHWPITSLINNYWWPEPDVAIRIVFMLLCVPLAWCLYRFVEQPFRFVDGISAPTFKRNLAFPVLCVFLVVAGIGIGRSDGFAFRYPEELRNTLLAKHQLSDLPKIATDCSQSGWGCEPTQKAKKSVFLWGDSHAGHFAATLDILAQKAGFNTLIAASGTCPPLPSATRSRGFLGAKAKCLKENKRAFKTIINNPNIEIVILAARWSYYVEGSRFGSEIGSPNYIVRSNRSELSLEASRKLMFEELSLALKAFSDAGKKVHIIMQVPELTSDGQRCFILAKVNHENLGVCDVERSKVDVRQENYRSMLNTLAQKWDNVSLIDLNEQFCGTETCGATLSGNLAYSDSHHILPGAAWKLLSVHYKKIFQH